MLKRRGRGGGKACEGRDDEGERPVCAASLRSTTCASHLFPSHVPPPPHPPNQNGQALHQESFQRGRVLEGHGPELRPARGHGQEAGPPRRHARHEKGRLAKSRPLLEEEGRLPAAVLQTRVPQEARLAREGRGQARAGARAAGGPPRGRARARRARPKKGRPGQEEKGGAQETRAGAQACGPRRRRRAGCRRAAAGAQGRRAQKEGQGGEEEGGARPPPGRQGRRARRARGQGHDPPPRPQKSGQAHGQEAARGQGCESGGEAVAPPAAEVRRGVDGPSATAQWGGGWSGGLGGAAFPRAKIFQKANKHSRLIVACLATCSP